MCEQVVAAVAVGGDGLMKFGVFSQFCEAIADLIAEHPKAAEFTARKMGQVFQRLKEHEEYEREESRARTHDAKASGRY